MNGKQTYIHAGKPPIYIIFLKKLHFPAETAEIQAGEVVQVCNPNTGGGGLTFGTAHIYNHVGRALRHTK